MPTRAEERKSALLLDIQKMLDKQLPSSQHTEINRFVTHYYSQIDAEDFIARSAEEWAGAALSHFAFAKQFQHNKANIRIFNPDKKVHGWESRYTVIEFVNDDMPFLVDSIAMEISRQGFTSQQIIHPLFSPVRDEQGSLLRLDGADASGTKAGESGALESWIHVEIDRVTDAARIKTLSEGLAAVLADVRTAVEDWRKMRARLSETIADMGRAAKAISASDLEEAATFLNWVGDDHFTFLGCRDYELATVKGEDVLKIMPQSGLGILREPRMGGISASFSELPKDIRTMARQPRLLILTKANSRATVHRPGYLDYIGVQRFDEQGEVIGERRFIGLYTSTAYHANLSNIPLLRRKVARVIERAGFPPASHAGKNLFSILDTYPRDELFQISEDELYETALGILRLGERARTRVFVRRDLYARFFSCLIYVPRESYNTELRKKIQDILKRTFNGISSEFNVQLSESMLARIHMLIRTAPTDTPKIDTRNIEAQIIAAMRRWEDDLFALLAQEQGEEAGNVIQREYSTAFPAAYREDVTPRDAVRDLTLAQLLTPARPITMTLYKPAEGDAQDLRFRLYRLGEPVPLSGSLPMLENMGVRVEDERSYELARSGAPALHIHDFGLSHSVPNLVLEDVKAKFENAFRRVWEKQTENDGLNRLTLAAALASEEIVLLRAYAKYLKQTGFTFSQSYIEQTLATNAAITRQLVELFHARFDPAAENGRADHVQKISAAITQALDHVTSADEDRILRRFLAVLMATLRTNYYQHKTWLSFKLESAKVPELPEPRPLYEIFVYSPRVEGIHLRGGKVARGGLRWSDRMEDFRTEVLGLVKAQMVKNAVIVPVGSKGGFVLKAAPPATDREATLKEGVECYKTFLRGLLDLTDNLVKGKVVPPPNVVRYDADDPYLVVAADKGTATFSDYANSISAEYGHWLGDAFASGGSAGYDHKKMGITAKGAWESVKRHFREMGIDTQTTDFTVAGVGDMSGDVFGNGMLLSTHIRLIAAFDHRHIFLDPQPDAATSHKERARLFALPRSSWDDYDKSLISAGGGVFPRTAKSIPLTPAIKTTLGLDPALESMTPAELMRAILKAPVDLFYNGGIGTYVKASTQSHGEVGDRANDAIRIDGNALRCKVVAEGGNLGFTQLGRIEYAMQGGRLFTDAIDNSAGVDCSDHEVNIKILLNRATEAGELNEKQRNELLAAMTAEVGALVLKDNYFQTQALSVSGLHAHRVFDVHVALIRHLEKAGRLNRAVEYLPTEEDIAERKARKKGLTAPEGAVLLAYSKMELFDALVASDLVDDDYVAQALITYFPTPLQQKYREAMLRHPLKREIIATAIANGTVNRTGSPFIHNLCVESGASIPEAVRCYILARDVFQIGALWHAIDALDNRIPAAIQSDMFFNIRRFVFRTTLWFLRRRSERVPIAEALAFFAPGVEIVSKQLPDFLGRDDLAAQRDAEARLTTQNVPVEIARIVARLDALYSALDIVEVCKETGRSVELTAALYFALVGRLGLRWVAGQITALPTDTRWQSMARVAMRDDLANLQRQLTQGVLKLSPASDKPDEMCETWMRHSTKMLAHMQDVMNELKAVREADLAMLSVLLRELRTLV